jgi:hypothetical protein
VLPVFLDTDEAQARLTDWLDDGDGTVISRRVRIVLVSAGFDREITTTVLWLTDLYGLDIRCVRGSLHTGSVTGCCSTCSR